MPGLPLTKWAGSKRPDSSSSASKYAKPAAQVPFGLPIKIPITVRVRAVKSSQAFAYCPASSCLVMSRFAARMPARARLLAWELCAVPVEPQPATPTASNNSQPTERRATPRPVRSCLSSFAFTTIVGAYKPTPTARTHSSDRLTYSANWRATPRMLIGSTSMFTGYVLRASANEGRNETNISGDSCSRGVSFT